jgi:ABC-2 type transport system permease protein
MTELRGIYTLWQREVKRYLRDRARIVSSFVQPLLWLVIFGEGLSSLARGGSLPNNLTYQQYIFPGIVGQTLLFTSMFMGISVIWDREFGFLKEIMVAPISQFSVFLGKMLGDSTDALIQGTMVFVLGAVLSSFLGINLNIFVFLESLPIMILITFGLVGVGLTVASLIESLESFGVIQSFINLPLFFLSGAIIPLSGSGVPKWLQIASRFDPLTYGVDALRTIIDGKAWTLPLYPLYFDILVICVFDVAMITIGTFMFSRRK